MNFIDNQLNYFAKKNENSILISNEEIYAYLTSKEQTGEALSYDEIKRLISLVQQNTIIQTSYDMRREGMENERDRWLVDIQEGHLLLDWRRMDETVKDKLELMFNENIYHQELKTTWKLNSFIPFPDGSGETYEDSTLQLHDIFIRRNKDDDFMEVRRQMCEYVVDIKRHVGTYRATKNGQPYDYDSGQPIYAEDEINIA